MTSEAPTPQAPQETSIQDLAIRLDTIEKHVRENRLADATHALKDLQQAHPGWPPETLPRAFWARLAQLFRRAGEEGSALRMLEPLIHPKVRAKTKVQLALGSPTSDEKLEYALALSDLGVAKEAEQIVQSVEQREVVRAYFVAALLKSKQYEFDAATAMLRQYVASPRLRPAEVRLGQINLLATFVEGRQPEAVPEARELADSLVGAARAEKSRGQVATLLELRARLELTVATRASGADRVAAAERALAYLREALAAGGPATATSLSRRKWTAVAQLFCGDENAAAELQAVRQEAVRARQFEFARDCDFQLALATRDRALVERLYFGTPVPIFKERLLSEFSEFADALKRTTHWQRNAVDHAQGQLVLDLITGQTEVRNVQGVVSSLKLKPGQLLHRLLSTLACDVYQPFSTGRLFGTLFPERQYQWRSSPLVVHQAIFRARTEIEEAKLPLEIVHSDGLFELVPAAGLDFLLTGVQHSGAEVALDAFILKWQEAVGRDDDDAVNAEFSARELAEVMNVPLRSVQRSLKESLDSGKVTRSGSGPKARYRIANT